MIAPCVSLKEILLLLQVFGPLVSDKLKLTAEDIEMGLVESNATNAQLHIALLKVFDFICY